MATKTKTEAQNPLILRCQRLIEAFAKSDDERDFYLDRREGFILYVDLDKPQDDLASLEKELVGHADRYVLIPKLTFYETKKIMEGFVNEKVYDIDTKEKLLDIIQSKEARENFLEFIYDHHSELEKWQQFYQERSRIRIIEWLRNNHFHFVFEEDLDLAKSLIEKIKKELFDPKASKEVVNARKTLFTKAKTYYSNEALNPRPKRGRPPKQAAKLEIEPQISTDIYTTVPSQARPFLFVPDYSSSSSVIFSSKFESEEQLLASRRAHHAAVPVSSDLSLESLNQKLASLRSLSSRWTEGDEKVKPAASRARIDEEEEEEEFEEDEAPLGAVHKKPQINGKNQPSPKGGVAPKGKAPSKPVPAKKPIPVQNKKTPPAKAPKKPLRPVAVKKPVKKPVGKIPPKAPPKKAKLRSIIKPAAKAKNAKSSSKKPPNKKMPLRSILKKKPKHIAVSKAKPKAKPVVKRVPPKKLVARRPLAKMQKKSASRR